MKKNKMPRMISLMSPFPVKISSTQTLDEALCLMRDNGVHHLPVISEVSGESDIVGLISMMDIERAQAFRHSDVEKILIVSDICHEGFTTADAHDCVYDVVRSMAVKHIDAVLISRDGDLVGLFTRTDVCFLFANQKTEEPDDLVS